MIYDGKVYRNLESQVGYLTEVAEALDERITEVAANIPSKMIVEELPEEGDPNITYYVGPKGTEPNLYYEVWVWVQEEKDGPFIWRELEDTDQVDLSGYLPIQTAVTTYDQVYAKKADGTQGMIGTATGASSQTAGFIAVRASGGHISVPDTPTQNYHATSKIYVDNNFVAKQTGATSNPQVYLKDTDGSQAMVDVDIYASIGTIVQRTASGNIYTEDPLYAKHAVNMQYADGHYLAKQTGTTNQYQLYCKKSNGEQTMLPVAYGLTNNAVVARNENGQILVPTTPTDNAHAASKAYVDAAVGQLIYHHDMVIIYTLTGDTDYVKIAAHSDNNTSTAFTGIDWHNMPLIMPDYAVYHHGSNDYLASVTKLPRGLHQDEFSEPQDGFLLTYWDGSALQNVRVNGSLFNTPTVTDVVTTW